jgi:hypothetical protein
MLTLVYEDELLRIYWHEQQGYFLSDWQPVFRKGEELRQSYQACVDAAQSRPGAPWLIDASKYAVVDPADAKWIAEVFWPQFAKAGVKFQAAISPAKAVGKMSARRSSESLTKFGTLVTCACETRVQAEAAIAEWRAKQRGH